MHDDRLGRPDPSLDLRDRARRRRPNNSWSTVATSFPSVGQVLVHVLHKEEKGQKDQDQSGINSWCGSLHDSQVGLLGDKKLCEESPGRRTTTTTTCTTSTTATIAMTTTCEK